MIVTSCDCQLDFNKGLLLLLLIILPHDKIGGLQYAGVVAIRPWGRGSVKSAPVYKLSVTTTYDIASTSAMITIYNSCFWFTHGLLLQKIWPNFCRQSAYTWISLYVNLQNIQWYVQSKQNTLLQLILIFTTYTTFFPYSQTHVTAPYKLSYYYYYYYHGLWRHDVCITEWVHTQHVNKF